MPHYFKYFPKIQYYIGSNTYPTTVQNPLVRFRILEAIQDKSSVFYTHSVNDGERADVIAAKYYDDDTLDWVIFLTNKVINPQFEWPLDYHSFIEYLDAKYGSVSVAQSTIHHYEQILSSATRLYDGTNIPERVIRVDETTYNSLSNSERKIVYNYDYEEDLNNKRRNIKVLDKRYISSLLDESESIFR